LPQKKCDEHVSDLATFLKGKFSSRADQVKRSCSYDARENAAKEVLDRFRGDPEFIAWMTPLVNMGLQGKDGPRMSALRDAWYCVGEELGIVAERRRGRQDAREEVFA
jgi:hypothetical protein